MWWHVNKIPVTQKVTQQTPQNRRLQLSHLIFLLQQIMILNQAEPSYWADKKRNLLHMSVV